MVDNSETSSLSQISKVAQLGKQQRIFITNINSLLGHSLFETLRNDHILIHSDNQASAHRFLGTFNPKKIAGVVNSVPGSAINAIKIIDSEGKPKTFVKQIRNSDYIILDISQFSSNLQEAQKIIKALKYEDSTPEKQQILILVSSPMVWSGKKGEYTEQEYKKRVPLPKFIEVKQLEEQALALTKVNNKLRVHIVCSGFLYGQGEQNDLFYEFFRRAWLSLHPKLAALPVINGGKNNLPTIHVADLAQIIDLILVQGVQMSKYLIAVDQARNSTQEYIMTAISEGIGSGQTQNISISECSNEPWSEFMLIDVKLQTSHELQSNIKWKCPDGINKESMKMLNEEFNYYRGLFPLKVFITGPPCSGKSHFGKKLSEMYGVPHFSLHDFIQLGSQLQNELGAKMKKRIEELKDQAEADYEKTKKKKDPDFDKANYHPRLPDDILHELTHYQLNTAGCMNKGFIIDGYPRTVADAASIFENHDYKLGEDPIDTKYQMRILPQFVLSLEADDQSLQLKAKEIPHDVLDGTHWNEVGMARRLKEYRGRNPDNGETVQSYFTNIIGYQNVLKVNAVLPEKEQLSQMQEMIEAKGKPCCINMINSADKNLLGNLSKSGITDEEQEEKRDELTLLIEQEEEEAIRKEKEKQEKATQKANEEVQRKAKEAKEAKKAEELRQQERDLLDQRSQPIRQYLMDNVVPHLTEGLISLCKDIPDDPVDFLAEYLLQRADEIDKKIIKEREEAALAKLEAKNKQIKKA